MSLYNNITAADIKAQSAGIANEIEREMARWKYFADSLINMAEIDVKALSISDDYYSNLMAFRSDLIALEDWYRKNSVNVKRFAQLVVF
jgi:hypothetical protein